MTDRKKRGYRREKRFTSALNVPMEVSMREALEAIADEEEVSVVEATRRAIAKGMAVNPAVGAMGAMGAMEAKVVDPSDEALAHTIKLAAGGLLSGQLPDKLKDGIPDDRNAHPEEISRAVETCERLGLDDLVILLRRGDEPDGGSESYRAERLAFVVLAALDLRQRLEAERYALAERRVKAYFHQSSKAVQPTLKEGL